MSWFKQSHHYRPIYQHSPFMEGFEWALRAGGKGISSVAKMTISSPLQWIPSLEKLAPSHRDTRQEETHFCKPPRDLELCGHLSRIQIAKHLPWRELHT